MKKTISLFIMPRGSSDWRGSEGLWITVAGWAAAAERKFGKAFILTTDRVATPKEVLQYPLGAPKTTNSKGKKITAFLPLFIITLIKDILLWKTSLKNANYDYEFPDMENGVSLVWEQHDFFPGIGYKLSKKYKLPFIIYVHAPQVWESAKWGVRRPVWGKLLEKMEARSLKRADIVACVSPQVADKLKSMGIPENKILISPMAIDGFLYSDVNSDEIKEEYNLNDKFVIGWTGSFRGFHGLESLVQTFKVVKESIPNAHLLLVGDGMQMEEIKALVRDLNLQHSVSFPGRMSFLRMTKFVHAFDLAILSASKESDFHYSPMKLREYLKAGRPTMAPNAGEIPLIFTDDVHLKLFKIGDIEGTAQKIITLYKNREKLESLGFRGREYILKNGTWDVELEKALEKINAHKQVNSI